MEVINGANKIVNAYDAFDAKAVEVWDKLLCDGKRITALGGSDAHIPEDIGSAWTGVSPDRLEAASIISSLQQGCCFASEAALIDFSCNGMPMSSEIRIRKNTKITLAFKIADSAGIASVSIVSNGKTLKNIDAGNKTLVKGSIIDFPLKANTYYRLESASSDGRRAFSTPIYVLIK